MNIKSKDIQIKGHRCLVISDIHGHVSLFKKALKKSKYQPGKDILIVLGDIIEKGPSSLEMLHVVMELSKHPNVYIVSGNCDAIPVAAYQKPDIHWLFEYLIGIEWKEHTLIRELCRKEDLSFSSKEELVNVLQKIFQLYPEEFAFLSFLPHVLCSEEYLFVHGGIVQEEEPYADSPHDLMKNDYFASKDVKFQKTIVCGHTPVMNYDTTYFDCNPHFDREKNILSIDGGCGVKDFGQINILIINEQVIQYQYVDELSLKEIQEDFIPLPKERHCIAWMDNKIEILETKDDVASCRHCSTGIVLEIPYDHLFELADGWHTHDYSDFQLEVHVGESVGIITTWKNLVYVKKDGILGWVPKTCFTHSKP